MDTIAPSVAPVVEKYNQTVRAWQEAAPGPARAAARKEMVTAYRAVQKVGHTFELTTVIFEDGSTMTRLQTFYAATREEAAELAARVKPSQMPAR